MLRKKRKSRAINWAPVLAISLAVSVAAGLMFSPLTSVRRLRVLGAQPHDLRRIQAIADQKLHGVPFMLVPSTQVEGAVMASRDVYNVTFTHNLFGSAILRVTYRRPVAVLTGVPRTYLDDQGVLYSSPEAVSGLRELAIDPEYLEPGAALTLPWPSETVADLCTKLESFQQLQGCIVHLDQTGRLLISREDYCTVDLGGTEQLDEKLSKLRRLLDDDPQLLSHLQSLSLVEPSRPAYISRKNT